MNDKQIILLFSLVTLISMNPNDNDHKYADAYDLIRLETKEQLVGNRNNFMPGF